MSSQSTSVVVSSAGADYAELKIGTFGQSVIVAKGDFYRTNFIIQNTQGNANLKKYWYFRSLLTFYTLYFFCSTIGSALHIGAAIATFCLAILWLLLFCQYIYVVKKTIPIVLKHPVIKGMQKLNELVEVELNVVKGQYTEVTASSSTADYDAAYKAGIGQVIAGTSKVRFQVINSEIKNSIIKTAFYSVFLVILSIFQICWGIAWCIITPVVLTNGKLSVIDNNNNDM